VDLFGVNGGSGRFATHCLHKVTPRKLQMMQTNVPQSAHGYPSDARSSFPQARHIIRSFSRRFFDIAIGLERGSARIVIGRELRN
jgi:hypothetical protein